MSWLSQQTFKFLRPGGGACFDPGTLAIVAGGAALAGTAMQVAGALQQANATSKADKRNAAVASQNATISQQQGQANLLQQQNDSYRRLGAIKAGYGASGVTSDGSPMDVLADSYTQSELDANTIIYNSKLKAAGYTNTANNDEAAASNAKTAGYEDAASKALLGAGRAGSAYNTVGTGGVSGADTLVYQGFGSGATGVYQGF